MIRARFPTVKSHVLRPSQCKVLFKKKHTHTQEVLTNYQSALISYRYKCKDTCIKRHGKEIQEQES